MFFSCPLRSPYSPNVFEAAAAPWWATDGHINNIKYLSLQTSAGVYQFSVLIGWHTHPPSIDPSLIKTLGHGSFFEKIFWIEQPYFALERSPTAVKNILKKLFCMRFSDQFFKWRLWRDCTDINYANKSDLVFFQIRSDESCYSGTTSHRSNKPKRTIFK